MAERKLLSAFMTSIIAFFALPLLFMQPGEDFLQSAFSLTVYVVPLIFTYGFLTSYIADKIAESKMNVRGYSFLLHLAFGTCIVFPITFICLTRGDEWVSHAMTSAIAGFIVGSVYFFVDLALLKIALRMSQYSCEEQNI
ncbi:hypothetical protein JFL43_05210 [Viridibacillus sp. YIM B01967]|uniref:Uncharacterized protein n=1 Tax=Viridibacillus soli TaxID=2798301 RepID=A0ABS1H531_9BACL|nr:hypothetical protein [Viridibacillus soli]MBK3494262.1 hypothetical protein [Viridibacillus soli]